MRVSHPMEFIKNIQIPDNKITFFNKISSLFILVAIFGFSISILSSMDIPLASCLIMEIVLNQLVRLIMEIVLNQLVRLIMEIVLNQLVRLTRRLHLVLPVFTWAAYQNGSFVLIFINYIVIYSLPIGTSIFQSLIIQICYRK